jgi:tetratricopeptide (TPR) repeat protein
MLIELLRKVLGRSRDSRAGPESVVAEALALESAGRSGEARQTLREALDRGAAHSNALLRTLARLEAQGGEARRAVALLTEAVDSDPTSADALGDLGNAYLVLDADAEAESAYQRALAINPGHAASLNNLGLLRARRGEREAALDCFRRAIRSDPGFSPALRNLVAWLPDTAVPEADIAMLEGVITRMPRNAAAHAALGVLHLRGAFNAAPALAALDRAIGLGADDAQVHTARGVALHELGRHAEALAEFERTLAQDPRDMHARFHRSITLLAQRRYAEGWPDYDLRLKSEGPARREFPQAPWEGQDLAGRTIFVYAEQGVGDEILFAGCLPDVVARAAQVVVDCDPRLVPLYRRSFPSAEIRGASQFEPTDWASGIEADYQAAIGSLPRFLRRSADDFPQHHGYLRADTDRAAHWRAQLARGGDAAPRVGLSWRGGTLRSRGPSRSIDLEQLVPLFEVPHIQWVILQRGASAGELNAALGAAGKDLASPAWPDTLENLDDTAALLGAVDLVITVDNTIAQLAGATGRPVWILLPFAPEWRYGMGSDGTPWYPTAKLFRQDSHGEWKSPVHRAARELCTWADGRR